MFLGFIQNALQNADESVISSTIDVERSVFGNILNIIRFWGSGIAIIMLTYMSISYFAADGRGMPWAIEKKADIKGTQLRNFAIGAFIFIGASNILYFVTRFVEDLGFQLIQ